MNQSKTVGIVVGLAIVVIAGSAAAFITKSPPNKKYTPPSSSPSTNNPTPNPTTIPAVKTPTADATTPAKTIASFTISQVATHNQGTDCWSVVNGNVYNLTDWIARHPGGDGAILGMCGIDASDAFNGQHGGQGRPERILAGMQVGVLAK